MSLRQRIPFRFSDNDPEDDHILDEQEQEELIESLRRESDAAMSQYLFLVQIVIESPLYALLPYRPPTRSVPLPTFFALLHILLHLNLCLLLLHPTHPIRRTLSPLPPPLNLVLSLPFPFSHPLTLVAPVIAPGFALLLRCGWPDVAWWCVAGGMTWFVYSVKRWTEQSDAEIRELESLRYDARGA